MVFRKKSIKNGSKEARTPDLSRVRRTLIPAELCFRLKSIIALWNQKSIGMGAFFDICIDKKTIFRYVISIWSIVTVKALNSYGVSL